MKQELPENKLEFVTAAREEMVYSQTFGYLLATELAVNMQKHG